MKILISGAGIAGPTLAYWLAKFGHNVQIVEQAPRLRTSGYAIDFWGAGYDIAEKMGLIPEITSLGYQLKEVRFVDRFGRNKGGFEADVFRRMTNHRFTSVRRSDLAATIYHAIEGTVTTTFGDSITELCEVGEGVQVKFEHAAPSEVDLVIGADGLHSRVRELAFGPESAFEVFLHYYVAAFELEDYPHRDELVYVSHNVPGRQVSRFSMRDGRTLVLFVFRDEYLKMPRPSREQEYKDALNTAFAGVGWECPEILSRTEQVHDLYFDRVSQIRMDQWSKGRIALIGDAAACASLLAGEGSGLAMTEAYTLAKELERCGNDYATAFTAYERRLRPFLHRKQESATKFASSFAPRTALGIGFRNTVTSILTIPWVADFLIGRTLRDDIDLDVRADHFSVQ